MKARFLVFTAVAAGLAGCAADPSAKQPGPAYANEMKEGRPGMLGSLTWNIDISGKEEPARASGASPQEQEEFRKWRESMGASERQEFEDWRSYQEWKRKNQK
jgi:hypothetical protein